MQTIGCAFHYEVGNNRIDIKSAINRLLFRFVDVHKFNK